MNIPKLGNPMLYGYQYDQLNRIVRMDAFTGLSNAANTFTPVRTDDYHEEVSYDPNGNIRIYKRNGSTATSNQSMDELEYFYNVDTNGKLLNNKLRHVTDAVTTHTVDLGTQNADNYTYDEIGNLTADSTEGISSIEWTVYGKIKMIIKTNQDTIRYTYDAAGNRISKNLHSPTVNKNTFYIRDASGNVMSIYQEGENTINDGDLTQTELHLYGSSRLGVYNVNVNTECAETYTELTNFIRGNKFFELSNHLGNVLATISDKKLGHNSGADTIDYNFADVVTANDYYPFGMLMPGRKFDAGSSYRYGFNGKENDNEVKGEGNQQDYGLRVYDTRLGRFLSVDPLAKDYPWNSTYTFAENDILRNVDLDGGEKKEVITRYWQNSDGIILSNTYTLDSHNEFNLGNGTLNTIIVEKMSLKNGVLQFETPGFTSYEYIPEPPIQKQFSVIPSGCNNTIPMQEFGFVLYGNANGTTLDLGGTDAKFKEGLNLGTILTSIGDARPSISGFIKNGNAKKVVEALESFIDAAERGTEAKDINITNTKSSNTKPIIKTDKPVPTKGWNYYERNKDGTFKKASRQSGLSDSTVPGKNGDPDTIYKRPITIPLPPKKDIIQKK